MQELNAIQNASAPAIQAAALSCDYRKTIALLRALKAGTVSLDNVTMTADDGWTVAEAEPPAEPTKEHAEVVVGPLENALAAEPPEEVE